MDRITRSLLDRFILENQIKDFSEDKAFEHFIGYLITSVHYQESFDTNDIITGSGGDCGIDSITILVNGAFITEPEEISDIVDSSTYLDVEFIMTQSETSSSFDTQKIGQFCYGVKDIFQEKSTLVQNDSIKLKKKIVDIIFENSSKFKNHKPNLHLYYATTGKWVDDKNLKARSESEKKDLIGLNLFENVHFDFIDADIIQRYYRRIATGSSQEIKITNYTLFPELEEIDQSFIAYIDSNEFLKLLLNDDDSINQSIFYDNIRDWQELNPVNTEIANTISNEVERKYFHLFNNGVTIVADEIKQTGNKFLLVDYQIVNGCQTSYAVYNNREKLAESITIPVRLISTRNQEIKNKIIKATNRQTPISDDMLYALSELPKKLEMYFDSYIGEYKIYFERRPKQYSRDGSIDKMKVINFPNLVKAFASAFIDLPHQTTRNYKQLIKNNNEVIFAKNNVLEMYYLCALLNYRFEKALKQKDIDIKMRPAKWHMIMTYIKLSNKKLPRLNSHEMERYCTENISEIIDEHKFKLKLATIVSIITDVANGDWQRDNIRTEPFTKKVIVIISSNKYHLKK